MFETYTPTDEEIAFLASAVRFEFGVDYYDLAENYPGDADFLLNLFLTDPDALSEADIDRAAEMLSLRTHQVPFVLSQMQSILCMHSPA